MKDVNQADGTIYKRLSIIYRYILNHKNKNWLTVRRSSMSLRVTWVIGIRFQKIPAFILTSKLASDCPDKHDSSSSLQLLVGKRGEAQLFHTKKSL